MSLFDEFLSDASRGSVFILGLFCLLAFVANAVLLFWLASKRGRSELARCPKCGRMIICPHCSDDEPPPA